MRPGPKAGKALKIQGTGNDGRPRACKEHKRREELGRLEGGDSGSWRARGGAQASQPAAL